MNFDTFTVLMLGWTAFAVGAISPGPNMVAVVSRSLGSGRTAGLCVAFGIGLGAFIWAWVSTMGFSELFLRVPAVMPILSIVGGGYLLYLGYKGIRSAFSSSDSLVTPVENPKLGSNVMYGLAVTLSNPKVAIVWASLATFVAPALPNLLSVFVFAFGAMVLGFVIYGLYGLVFSVGVARKLYQRFSRFADATFGAVFALLGGVLLRQSH